jgi:hypothetical protein
VSDLAEPVGVGRSRGRDALAAASLALILTPLLLRATTLVSVHPGWEFDPLVMPSTTSGLTPAASMLADACTLLGAALAFFAFGVSRWVLGLALLGAVPILYHGFLAGEIPGAAGPRLHDQRLGLAWLSAVLGAAGLRALAAEARWRAAAIGMLLGLLALLALRAAVQVLVDHPATVAQFTSDRAEILAAQGWAEGSPQARAYERRLLQNDASAWFGLSNVLAGLAAAGTLASAGLLAAAWRRSAGTVRFGLGALLVASLTTLVAAQSKGGYGSLLLGAGAGLVVWRWPRWGGAVAVGCLALTLSGIVARGMIGERLAELSILFRWYYVTAAAEIGARFPLLGVGPDGFRDAFLLVKNPLCPEEVASPHSALLDWWACLGLAGLTWGALLVGATWRAGAAAGDIPKNASLTEHSNQPLRPVLRLVVAIVAIATLLAMLIDGPAGGITAALSRVAGVGLWALCAAAVTAALLTTPGRWSALGLSAGAIALAAHAQIEVTLSWPQSAGPVLALIALAGAGTPPRPSPASRPGRWSASAAGLLLAGVTAIASVQTFRLERDLLAASRAAEFAGRILALSQAAPGRSAAESAEAARIELRGLLQRPVVPAAALAANAEGDPLRLLDRRVLMALIDESIAALERAEARAPGQFAITRELARMNLLAASLSPEDRAARHAAAVAWARRPRPTAGSLHWQSQVFERVADGLEGPERIEALTRAAEAALATWTLDPTNPRHGVRAVDVHEQLALAGDSGAAARLPELARRTLALEPMSRLDPLVRGLGDAQLKRLQALASQEAAPLTAPPATPPVGREP